MLASTSSGHHYAAQRFRFLAVLAFAALLATLLPLTLPAPTAPAPATPQRPARLPLIVMPTGDPAAPFSAYGLGTGVAFAPDGLRLNLEGEPLAVRFVEPRPDVALVPLDRRAATISTYRSASSTAHEQLPTYAALAYHGLFPGVDLRYDGVDGNLKGTYLVAPHADPAAIRWRYDGAERLAIDPVTGDLLIGLPGGATLREEAPIAWQELSDGRVPVPAHFVLAGDVASFQLGAYDPAQPLVIDPTLTLGTYLGGSSGDYGRGITVDRQGFIYLVGDSFSSNFLGQDSKAGGEKDVVVLKLTPAGDDLVYAVFAGGSGSDEGLAITVNSSGEAFVLADPDLDFPLRNAPIATAPAVGDGVLMKLSAAGQLLYSTYLGLGLSNTSTGKAVALGADGKLYVAGETYIATQRLGQLALVEVNPTTGAIVRSFDRGETYITTTGAAVAVGPAGRVYLVGTVGYPYGGEFPVTENAFQKQCGRKLLDGEDVWCRENAFLMIFSPEFAVEYASYLGGSGADDARGLAVDSEGNAIIAGNLSSVDFPVKNGLMPSCPYEANLPLCSYNGYVTKLSPTAGLIYSTYIGSYDEAGTRTFINDVAVDSAGNAYVAGFSTAAKLPVKDALQPYAEGQVCAAFSRFCYDAYVLGLAPDGSLRFGTYLGGQYDEYGQDIAVDGAGAVYMTGYSAGIGFPTTAGSIQPAKGASTDFFVAKIAFGGTPLPQPGPGTERKYKAYLPLIKR